MLRIIEGGFFSVAYEKIKSEIKELTRLGKRVYLLVPEQQALIAEKEFVSILPEHSALTFEVTNFTRLANTVYRSLGGLAGEYADRSKEALIMWKTLSELSPLLDMTRKSEINTGMVDKALLAVSEMKNISATPDELTSLAKKEELSHNPRLVHKLSDLSMIMSLYTRLFDEKYKSTKDECEHLCELLINNPDFFSDCNFFVTGFTSFTEPQYKVLAALMKQATLTVHLTISRENYEHFEFTEIKKTKERLIRAADLSSVKKELVRAEAMSQGVNMQLAEVCNLMWRSFGKIDNNNLQNDTVRIFESSDPYEECDFIASDIKRKVMTGERFADFAIVARDINKYSGILDTSFDGADIPYFLSRRKDISSYEAIKLIYTAFATIESDFSRENVISYIKCHLCGVSAEACDEFELYTEIWQINKSRFYDGLDWNMSPGGYDTRHTDSDGETLTSLNKTRYTVITPLIKLRDNLLFAHTVKEYATALFNFLDEISLEEKLAKSSDELLSLGEGTMADEVSRLWGIICTSLDTLVEVLSDSKVDTKTFVNLLKILLSEADIGRIPAAFDTVTLGSADMIRLTAKKHVYILGVNNGEFPRTETAASYFTDADKALLSQLGLNTEPMSDIAYARELFFFSRAFSSAKCDVTLSYSLRNEAFEASKRADIIGRLISLSDGLINVRKISSLPPIESIYTPSLAIELAKRGDVADALRDAGFIREYEMTLKNITNSSLSLSENVARSIYSDDVALTQTRIDTYVSCPFSYYLKFNIRLSENQKAEFDARNIGTFIHSILENLLSELKSENKKIKDLTSEDKSLLVYRASKNYIQSVVDKNQLSARRTDIMIDRLCKAAMPIVDGLAEEFAGCAFSPEYFELKIENGSEELPRPATFVDSDGKSTYVYGSIDRVDTYKSGNDVYVRVVDYKTGAKVFSPSDIEEGKNLQMFLYLKAIADTECDSFKKKLGVGEGGRIIPAGVIYLKTDMSDITISHADEECEKIAVAKNQKRHGMLLSDEISLGAMNKDFLPVKFNSTGEVDKRYEKYLYSEEDWRKMTEKISDVVLDVSRGMRGGNISLAKSGKDSPCEYCKFKPICRK